MSTPLPPPVQTPKSTRHPAIGRIRLGIVVTLHVIMAVELVALLLRGSWASSVWLLAIVAVTAAPMLLGPRLPVRIPAEFELLAIVFVFASLFLGEFHSFYERFWWWDIALHSSSGLLLGIVGFLLVYMLNENRRIDLHMRPGFVALFAFAFAVTVGALWEIFEFAADQLFGIQMQKPMLGSIDSNETNWISERRWQHASKHWAVPRRQLAVPSIRGITSRLSPSRPNAPESRASSFGARSCSGGRYGSLKGTLPLPVPQDGQPARQTDVQRVDPTLERHEVQPHIACRSAQVQG